MKEIAKKIRLRSSILSDCLERFFILAKAFIVIFLFCSPLFLSFSYGADTSHKRVQKVKSDSIKTRLFLQKLLDEAKEEIKNEKKPKKREAKDGLEIDGLIFNETKTKIGQEFYEVFYTLWDAPKNIKDYSVFISERGAGQWGSWVLIRINDRLIYQNRMKPRSGEIEDAAKNAVGIARNFLFNYERLKKQLTGEDLKGSGIY